MKTNQIIIIVALAIVIIGAIVCDIVRRRKYKPSEQLRELKQPLSLEYATQSNSIDTYTIHQSTFPSQNDANNALFRIKTCIYQQKALLLRPKSDYSLQKLM